MFAACSGAVRVPTLVLHHAEDIVPLFNARMLADGIPGAELKVLPGRDHMFWVSDFEESVSEIERFLTGSVGAASTERALATILFTDIVGSTERASELGDGAWRQLLERHDGVVRKRVGRRAGPSREIARRRDDGRVRRAGTRDPRRRGDPR